MDFVKSFDIFGQQVTQIPCLTGHGAPTAATESAVGCLYMDELTGKMYKCIAVTNGIYTWVLGDGKDGEKGEPGSAGYSPVRGKDYWTQEDIAAIIAEAVDSIKVEYPEAHVIYGDVNANNDIIIHGELADGTYTLKYEDVDGNVTQIGTLVIDGSYTNLIDTVGYEDGMRLSGSTGEAKEQSGCVTTGFIPIGAVGDVFRTSGVNFDEVANGMLGWCYFGVYDANKNMLGINNIRSDDTIHAAYVSVDCDANGNATITVNDGATVPGYIRLSGVGSGANLIVTKNEEIV